jgi:hypothetical protein
MIMTMILVARTDSTDLVLVAEHRRCSSLLKVARHRFTVGDWASVAKCGRRTRTQTSPFE